MSLRARLLLIVVVLAGGALIGVNVVTYTALRSFLIDRDQEQLVQAVGGVDRQLQADAALSDRRLGSAGFVTAPPVSAGARGSEPGTYGALLDATGNTVRTLQLRDGDTVRPPPKLPADIKALADRRATPIEVDAVSGPGRYLLVARHAAAGGGQVVVAAVPMDAVDAILDRLQIIEVLVTFVALVLIAVLGAWAIRASLRPLDRIGRTATMIAAGDLTQRVELTNERTEVGRLSVALNAMLAQIERAFSEREASEGRMRRFLADASHELRTPLTSIRGYAQAFRLGAADDPEDLARALGRIEHAAERMGVLVDDLLLLARLDAVRHVTGAPVDLAAVVDDACGDIRMTAPERVITFRGPAEGSVTVMADADQIYQIVDNLLRNALVHTPPEAAIDVAVRQEDGVGVLTVRDHGPGLPEGGEAHVFERFWQADASRGDRQGAGLGLAIVHAIVTAHSGTVGAANAPDGGAVFTIRLVLAPPSGVPAAAAALRPTA